MPLPLGPGFRLGARWNRLGEAVKTRKKREKTGGKWARYALRSVNKEGRGGITWGCLALVEFGTHSPVLSGRCVPFARKKLERLASVISLRIVPLPSCARMDQAVVGTQATAASCSCRPDSLRG